MLHACGGVEFDDADDAGGGPEDTDNEAVGQGARVHAQSVTVCEWSCKMLQFVSGVARCYRMRVESACGLCMKDCTEHERVQSGAVAKCYSLSVEN